MSELKSKIDWRAGDTWQIDATLFKADGTPWTDVAAAVWKLDSLDLATNFLTKTLGAGVASIGSGRILITTAAADTLNIPAGEYVHSCQVTDAAGIKSTQFFGRLLVRAPLT